MSTRVGLISDTHGLLRASALAFLQGSDHIIHAGDIGSADILTALAAIAPLTAVRGNKDTGDWASALAEAHTVHIGAIKLYVLHDLADLRSQTLPEDISIVICGHSHKPKHEVLGRVSYINPGSAGPRRFSLPISVGELVIDGAQHRVRLVTLAH